MKRTATIFAMIACLAGLALAGDWWFWAQNAMPSSSVFVPTASTNLVAWWRYSSGDGSYQPDYSGNNNILTQSVAVSRPSISNGAAWFNGTTNYFLASPETSFDFDKTTPWTITFWARFAVTSDTHSVYCKRTTDSAQTGISIMFRGDGFFGATICSSISGNNFINDKFSVSGATANNWDHYAVSYNGNTYSNGVSGYFNGSKQTTVYVSGGSLTGSILNNLSPLLGASGGGLLGWALLSGALDDFRVYNRELTTNEVMSIKNEGQK